MMQYTYLLVNFLTVIVCFVFSFHPKIRFDKHFMTFLKASVLVAIPFIIWDSLFTKYGIWWFSPDYIMGLRILGLPVEECLFFICIPFACVFTYFCLDKFFKLNWANAFNNTIVFIGVILCILIALLFYDKTYTFVTAVVTTLAIVYLHFIANAEWIGKASLVYLILMLGFFPVNGVLTGSFLESAVVNYNPNEFLRVRMFTIPIEDAVYGYTQFLLVIYFFKRFQKKSVATAENTEYSMESKKSKKLAIHKADARKKNN